MAIVAIHAENNIYYVADHAKFNKAWLVSDKIGVH